MKNKKILIICLIIIILISIITNIYILSNKPVKDEPTIEGINKPENKEILKDASVEGLKITNISLLTRNGISSYKAEVTNITNSKIDINKLYIIFHEEEKENKTLALYNISIEPNEKAHINITSEKDLSKTTKITYTIE